MEEAIKGHVHTLKGNKRDSFETEDRNKSVQKLMKKKPLFLLLIPLALPPISRVGISVEMGEGNKRAVVRKVSLVLREKEIGKTEQ